MAQAPPPARPRPPVGRIVVTCALLGAAASLWALAQRVMPAPGPELLGPRSPELALVDACHRLSVWLPQAAEEAGLPGVLRPTLSEEQSVAAYERMALREARPEPLAYHRLAVIYGERGYLEQAHEMLGEALAAGVDEEVCFALSAVYSDEPVTLTETPRLVGLLTGQPTYWALTTQARVAEGLGADGLAEYARGQAREHLNRFALGEGAVFLVVVVVVVVGIVGLITAIVRYLFTKDQPAHYWPHWTPVTGPWEIAGATALVVFCSSAVAVGLGLLQALVPLGDVARSLLALFGELVAVGPALIWVAVRVKRRGRRLQSAFALEGAVAKTSALRGVVGLGIAYVALAGVWVFVLPSLFASLSAASGTALGIEALLVVLVAPVAEELFFRGYLMHALMQRTRPIIAVVLSALAFTAAHAGRGPEGLLAILVLGVVSAYLFRYSRSLWPCIVLHALHNAIWLAAEAIARM